jgi:hypothetical protein
VSAQRCDRATARPCSLHAVEEILRVLEGQADAILAEPVFDAADDEKRETPRRWRPGSCGVLCLKSHPRTQPRLERSEKIGKTGTNRNAPF